MYQQTHLSLHIAGRTWTLKKTIATNSKLWINTTSTLHHDHHDYHERMDMFMGDAELEIVYGATFELERQGAVL